jgi:hypothetical protein
VSLVHAESAGAHSVGAVGGTADEAARAAALAAVAHGFDALAPMLDKLLADRSISGESAMHLVVMNSGAEPGTSFEDAILVERSFGDVASWEADYAWYARAKTRLAWREQMTLRTLFAEHRERLRDDDIDVEGAVRSGRWIVGASGAQAWYDHAIATVAIALFEAAYEHARHEADAA